MKKMAQTLALDKSKQKAVVKAAETLKKDIKSSKIILKTRKETKRERRLEAAKTRGLIYLGHLPHGFYEMEIKAYFSQFGRVTNVKVCRSSTTGAPKGYGYVEFLHPEVAKLAAETMNNYVMFKKRLIAEFVPSEKRPQYIFCGRTTTAKNFPRQRRRNKMNNFRNGVISEVKHIKQAGEKLNKLQRRMEVLKQLGFNYDLKAVDVPDTLQ